LGDKAREIDKIKRLADCLDLYARARNELGLDAGLARIHAYKFYIIAHAPTSAMKTGMDYVDEVLSRFKDPEAACDFIEKGLLPVIKEEKQLGYLIPVKAQFAVVLAYCGQIEEARKLMSSLQEFSQLSEERRAELQNQKNLIEQIAQYPRTEFENIDFLPTFLNKTSKKVGRNEPCQCGSGRKFKKCHGR
jgi:hypothetical protein